MTDKTPYQHWQLTRDRDGIRWLTLDRAGESQNSLSMEVLEELEAIVGQLEQAEARGLVLQSGKPGSFIVGADVREFDQVSDPNEAAESIRRVHALFDRIEKLPFPTVAVIEGYCLGGGLELVLAFDYRIARNVESTRLGFPEVKLGIFPGFGGSARSLELLGGQKAMEIMLTARMLRAGPARAMGLVDQLVGPHGSPAWAARRAIFRGIRPRKQKLSARLANSGPARRLLANVMRKKTAAKANPRHYPAPFELIDAFEQFGDDKRAMLEQEAIRVGRLITGDTSRNLRRVFHLMEMLKGDGKQSDFKARRVHVVGAGTMGGDIAAWCVLQGLEVTLQDREMKYIEPALKRAEALFKKRLKTKSRVGAARARLIADVAGVGAARADVVIEAIFENLEAKQKLFAELEKQVGKHTILATNTSALPLADIASSLKQPKRLIGLHFFNPVAKMPLVEVVWDPANTRHWIDDGAAFCNQIGRFPLRVQSSPGFLVNRVLGPYMGKALELVSAGTPKEALDRAALQFGMPMGPVELADTVGLDVALNVTETLGGADAVEQKAVLQQMVDAGRLGKKTGQGFYTWEDGKAKKDMDRAAGHDLEALARELLAPYFEECQACLADGIVKDADTVDAGMIFGTGFAPFRGGPLHYLASQPGAADEAEPEKATDTPEEQ